MKPKHFILTLLALFTSINASADDLSDCLWTDANGTEWHFDIIDGSATLTNRGIRDDQYVPSVGGIIPSELTVPSTVYVGDTPYTVTSIGHFAICNNFTYTSIRIPSSVTSIGEAAFASCPNLTSINIPNGVTSIGNSLFWGCAQLTSLNIPNGVTSIGHSAFWGCAKLTSINIPVGVTSIGNCAFHGCSSLTSIVLPVGATCDVGDEAFQGCSSLTSFTIPEGVTAIGRYAFQGCFSLTTVVIPDGVTYIGERAFSECNSLTSINIPSSVISIREDAFSNCYKLPALEIPASVRSIGAGTFSYCTSLTSIILPEGISTISSNTFLGCSRLQSVTIPNSVTTIEGLAFALCSSLTSITFPSNLVSLAANVFSESYELSSIHFQSSTAPNSLDGLPSHAILYVPEELLETYRMALPDYTISILPELSFSKIYEADVTANEEASAVINAIGEENALNVVNLKISGTINGYDIMVFRNKMINLRNLDLSNARVVANNYAYYGGWGTKDNVITPYFTPTQIEVFKLPMDITGLEYSAFSSCGHLRAIELPDNITTIPDAAFGGCANLSSIDIPANVTSIGRYTFQGCNKLTSIHFPADSKLSVVDEGAFWDCPKLNNFIFPAGLIQIGSFAFECCESLTEMHLPPYLTSIGENAFDGCSKLKTIYAYMPDIISIGTSTFNDYTHQQLYVPEFLYNNYYYNTNWSQFLNVNPTELEPDDYKSLSIQNTDVGVNEDGTAIPAQSNGDAVDVEVGLQGSFTAGEDLSQTAEDAQYFNHADLVLDGEGHGGSLIGEDNGSTAGNLRVNTLRVKINVKAGRWYFFCFPYDVTIANCTYPGQYAWRWYDGAERATNGSGGWKAVAGSTLTAGQGYAFQTSHTGNMVVEFSNPKFGGDRPKTLVAHAAANAANASWNLVGNPYSSFYDFLAADFDAPITVYNSNGTYSAYRPADDECHLQPFEAFFVQKPTEVDAINFNADRRESYNQGQTKKAERQKVRRRAGINPQRRLINLEILSGEELMDKTRVVLNNEKSHAYELDCDAAKMMSGDAKAQLYSVENGVNMAINERPQAGDIRLGYTAKAAGTLSISASRMDMPMMLVDTQLGTTFDLNLGSYDFDTAAGTFDGRFLLRPSGEATAINQLAAKTGVCIGTQDGGIAIGGAEGKTVRVFNAAGAEVGANDGNGFINLRSGIYVVSVDGVNAKVRVK